MNRTDHPRGQILAIVAGGLVILLLAVGLVIDTGLSWVVRRDSQNVSDLSSLAGTKVIAEHYLNLSSGGRTGSQVFQAIDQIATANGCDDPCTWTAIYVKAPASPGAEEQPTSPSEVVNSGSIPNEAQGVRVAVEQPSDTQFMRLIGIDEVEVSTQGTALTASPRTIGPGVLLPIAMSPPAAMVPGQIYNITDGKDGPGNFGWLSWDDSNDANTLVHSICTPDNPEITVPMNIPGGPGTMNKIEGRDCLDEYIANGTPVLIPLWDGTHPGNGSHSSYRIIGFAVFKLTSRDQPAVKNIQGSFVEYYPLTTVPTGYSPPGQGSSPTYFLGLIR